MRALIGTALVALAMSATAAQPQTSSSTRRPQAFECTLNVPSYQPAAPDARGTEQSPLVIKPLPITAKAQKQRDEDRADKRSTDLWALRLTCITACILLIQAIIFGIQTRAFFVQAHHLRQTVQATRAAAAALPNIERAYVFVRVSMPRTPNLSPDGSAESSLFIRISNDGRTPAILDQIRAVAYVADQRPNALPPSNERVIPPGLVLAANTPDEQTVRFRVSNDEWQNVIGNNGLLLMCCGRIRYRDVLGEMRETGFCWEYQEAADYHGFHISPDTPLNYWT